MTINLSEKPPEESASSAAPLSCTDLSSVPLLFSFYSPPVFREKDPISPLLVTYPAPHNSHTKLATSREHLAAKGKSFFSQMQQRENLGLTNNTPKRSQYLRWMGKKQTRCSHKNFISY